MKHAIFHYQDYKAYLRGLLSEPGARGMRSRLAQALGCGTSFVSQVLNGHVDFSLEQGMKVPAFLGHDEDEKTYFMLLLQYGRAGSRELAQFYQAQLAALRERQGNIQERLKVKKSLDAEAQSTYYSSWIYAAVHILISIPRYQTRAEIAAALGLPPARVAEALDFLVRHGLATAQGGRFRIGVNRLHVGKNSPLVQTHHANWRVKTLEHLERRDPDGTHFSLVMGFAEKDVAAVQAILLRAIEEIEALLRHSPEETLRYVGIDFFSLLRGV